MSEYKPTSEYLLDRTVTYGVDYPDLSLDYDLYKILYLVEKDYALNEIFSDFTFFKDHTELRKILLEKNFIEKEGSGEVDVESKLKEMSPDEISWILKKYGVTSSGKKKKLVKLALKNIPPEEFDEGRYIVSSEGASYMKERDWIEVYLNALQDFDFNDFNRFREMHTDSDNISLACDFIDAHTEHASLHEDYIYLDNCMLAKKDVYYYDEDYESTLKTLTEFYIHRLNPEFYSYAELFCESPIFNYGCSMQIRKLIKRLKISDFDEYFKEIWDEWEFKNTFMEMDECLGYIKEALSDDYGGEDYPSEMIYRNTFGTSEVLSQMGKFYYMKEDYKLAAEYFEMSLEQNPDEKETLLMDAMSCILVNDIDYAHEVLDEAEQIDDADGRVWNLRGICYLKEFKKDLAKKCFKKAQMLNPDDMVIWAEQANLYKSKKNTEKALEYYDKSSTLTDNIAPHLYMANIYTELGETDKAEDCFKKAYAKSGDSPDYLYEMALFKTSEENYDEAMECLDKCLEINDKLSEPWLLKSEIYKILGDDDKSKDALKKAENWNYYLSLGHQNLMNQAYFG